MIEIMEDLDLILQKDFSELTENEKNDLRELCEDEASFYALKSMLLGVDSFSLKQIQETQLKDETKESLDILFNQTYQNKGILWYNSVFALVYDESKSWQNQGWLKIAAMVLLVLAIYPFIPNSSEKSQLLTAELSKPKQEETKNEKKKETLSSEISNSNNTISDQLNSLSTTKTTGLQKSNARTLEFANSESVISLNPAVDLVVSSPMIALSAEKSSDYREVQNRTELSSNEKLNLLDLLTPTF